MPANQPLYSQQEMDELALHVSAGRDDFPYFCMNILGIELHEGQTRAWKGMEFSKLASIIKVIVILAGNRGGKTVLLACLHIWMLFYKKTGPGKEIRPEYWESISYVTANLAPFTEQTLIIYDHILKICRGKFSIRHDDGSITTNKSLIAYFVDDPSLGNPERAPKTAPYHINCANNATFRAYTLGGSHGDTIQGLPFAFISYDEFGRSKDPEGEYRDIRPRLIDWNGWLVIITTPDEGNAEASDWLSDKVEKAVDPRNGFKVIHWSTRDNPHISREAIDGLLVGLTAEQQKQVLSGTIVKKSVRWFPYNKVNLAFDQKRVDFKPIDFVNHFPRNDRRYFGGLDTKGMGKDSWSFYVIEWTTRPFRKVFEYTTEDPTPTENIAMTRHFIEQFRQYAGKSNFQWQIDGTAEGGTIVFDALKDLDPILFRFSIEKGTGRNMKFVLLDIAKKAIVEEIVVSPEDSRLQSQLQMYRGPKDDASQRTDRVMAFALAVYIPYLKMLEPAQGIFTDFD